MLREVLCEILQAEGAQVMEANGGHMAFELVQKNDFDVILSDERMPGGDGMTLAKNIMQLDGKKPLMFICSGFESITLEEAEKLNVKKVFEKPFDHNFLIQEVMRYLGIKSSK